MHIKLSSTSLLAPSTASSRHISLCQHAASVSSMAVSKYHIRTERTINVSHEFCTPVTSPKILGARESVLGEEVEDSLQQTNRNLLSLTPQALEGADSDSLYSLTPRPRKISWQPKELIATSTTQTRNVSRSKNENKTPALKSTSIRTTHPTDPEQPVSACAKVLVEHLAETRPTPIRKPSGSDETRVIAVSHFKINQLQTREKMNGKLPCLERSKRALNSLEPNSMFKKPGQKTIVDMATANNGVEVFRTAKAQNSIASHVKGALKHPSKKGAGIGNEGTSMFDIPHSPPKTTGASSELPQNTKSTLNTKPVEKRTKRQQPAGGPSVLAKSKAKRSPKKRGKAAAKTVNQAPTKVSTTRSKMKSKKDAIRCLGSDTVPQMYELSSYHNSDFDVANRPRNGKLAVLDAPDELSTMKSLGQVTAEVPYGPVLDKHTSVQTSMKQGLIDTRITRKSNIISWDNTGPLNQGKSPSKNDQTSINKPNVSVQMVSNDTLLPETTTTTPLAQSFALRNNPPASVSNVAPSVKDALSGLLYKNKETSDTSEVQDNASAAAAQLNQNPALNDACSDNGFQHIDDLDGPTLVGEGKVVSVENFKNRAQAMASDILKSSTKERIPRISKLQEDDSRVTGTIRDPQTVKQPSEDKRDKKRSSEERDDSPQPKRRRIIEQRTPLQAEPTKDDGYKDDALEPHPVLSSAGGSADISEDDNCISVATVPITKLNRTASYCTVDKDGSPVPDGMMIDDETTVLETFSQQKIGEVGDEEEPAANRSNLFDEIPSNLSSIPCRFSPFSGLPQVPEKPKKKPHGIFEFMRKAPHNLSKTNPASDRGEDSALVVQEGSSVKNKQGKPLSTFKDYLDQMTAKKPAQNHVVQDCSDQKRGGPIPVTTKIRGYKRNRAFSDATVSSVSSGNTSDTEETMDDVMRWREALQPHQLNLFDELVNISHRLVSHLVHHESATADLVSDYYKRGSHLIEMMEKTHKDQFNQELERLRREKESLRETLAAQRERLANVKRDVSYLHKQREVGSPTVIYAYKGVNQLMATYC